ncbi:hypothetical protein BT63DRAFT_450783 [Microthyrium microscopicum]|uniref:Secreted protein n=1 Tax=Microthyrium microscopicum TaxID=703497 RepID=A0A6A6UMU0_9PEZI|nr:hypothetical protein BT63DRAFT_450783 [Microthyrium microscopicum]
MLRAFAYSKLLALRWLFLGRSDHIFWFSPQKPGFSRPGRSALEHCAVSLLVSLRVRWSLHRQEDALQADRSSIQGRPWRPLPRRTLLEDKGRHETPVPFCLPMWPGSQQASSRTR